MAVGDKDSLNVSGGTLGTEELADGYAALRVLIENPEEISGGGGGGAVTLADGADATQGATADALVAAGAAGTQSSKLRRATQGLEDLKTLIVLAAGAARIGKITLRNAADSADIDPLADATFTGRLGEVSASPTANTLLDRLKALLTGIILAAGENHVGAVGGHFTQPSATFNRPANTTQYAVGDLVANSETAGSVVAMTLTVARISGGTGSMPRIKLKKSGTGIANAQFRLHCYKSTPTVANGDNGAWSTSESDYLGAFDVTVDRPFTDGAVGYGVPVTDSPMNYDLTGTTDIKVLTEARAIYTPTSGETFTITPDDFQD